MAVGEGWFGFVRLAGPLLAPTPMKNAEVENCHYWSGLVGRAGR